MFTLFTFTFNHVPISMPYYNVYGFFISITGLHSLSLGIPRTRYLLEFSDLISQNKLLCTFGGIVLISYNTAMPFSYGYLYDKNHWRQPQTDQSLQSPEKVEPSSGNNLFMYNLPHYTASIRSSHIVPIFSSCQIT